MKNKYPHFKPPQDLGKELDTIRSGNRTKYNNNYHIVWIPKYRRPMLGNPEVKKILEEIIKGQSEDKKWVVHALEIMPDHVHLFLSVPPTFAIDQVVKQLKGNSSIQLRRIFPELKERTSKALWAKGYYISTAGFVSQEQVKHYIEQQSIHLRRDRDRRENPQQDRRDGQRQLPTIPPTDKSVGFLVGS